jgi:protein-tyrosine phosphatase
MDDPPEEGLPAEAHLPIYDPETGRPIRANLDRISGMVEAARRGHAPVLLFCGHGIRRGPLAGAWYLHRHEGIPLDEAYARIRAVRPRIEHVQQWVRDSQPLFGRDPPRDPVGTGGAGRRSP